MSAEFDALKVVVTRNTTVAGSLISYAQGLGPLVADAAGDKAASLALAAEITSTADAMAAAVVTNTPAEPTP